MYILTIFLFNFKEQMFECPKCGFAFYNYQALENHVYRCLDQDNS